MSPLTTQDTTITYSGDGATTLFPFAFPYLDPSHVVVLVAEVVVDTVFNAPQIISISPPPTNGQLVEIKRQTPSQPIVEFADGTTILADDMTVSEAQARYIAEEARDLAKEALRFNDGLQAYDAENFKISNVADPVAGTDAANLRSLNSAILAATGATVLATYLTEITDLADQVHSDRVDIDTKKTAMDADAATAATLATDAAAGPDAATIIARVTAYLGSAAWLGGGVSAGGGGPVGAHSWWRIVAISDQINNIGSDPWFNFSALQFRTVPGTPEAPSGGSFITPVGYGGTAGGSLTTIFADSDNTARSNLFMNGIYGETDLGYAYASPIQIESVFVRSSTGFSNEAPLSFDISYSDDFGSTWTVVLQVRNTGPWGSAEGREWNIAFASSSPGTTYSASDLWVPPAGKSMALIQVWGAGASNNGGGGGYNEWLGPIANLPSGPIPITIGTSPGAASSFGSLVVATGGTSSQGGSPGGVALNNGEGASGSGGINIGGGPNGGASVNGGGGGRGTSGAGGKSANGGQGGNTGTSTQPTTPGGGGDTGQTGARGEVRVTVW